MSPEYKYFEEQVFYSTVRIERPETNQMGTGFLVEVPSCLEGKKHVFLVSNKHVLNDQSKETRIAFHLANEDGGPELGNPFRLGLKEFTKGYYESDDEDVDLALINVSNLVDVAKEHSKKNVYYRALNLDLFSDYFEPKLLPNNRIVFVGYPSDRFDTKNFLPIMRSGIIASIPKVDYENKPYLLVDAQVFQGSSGSPVFTLIDNTWKFIGVVFQAMVRNQKVQIVDTAKQAITQDMLGIGLVVKSTSLLDLINKTKEKLDDENCPDADARDTIKSESAKN